MRAFITGINGFVGIHLSKALLAKKIDVGGIYHPATDADELKRSCAVSVVSAVDIMDTKCLESAMAELKPDLVFHLAAQSHVPTSWENPEGTFEINVIGTMNVVNAAGKLRRKPKMLFISSGDVYGDGGCSKGTVTEKTPVDPLNPYAASKAAAELIAKVAANKTGVRLVTVRPFNHIGPGQSPAFVASDFASQLAKIEVGLQKPILHVGNLDARKDFTDVRDMVNAYLLAIERCPAGGVYNICSEKSRSIGEILSMLLSMSDVKPRVVSEAKRRRTAQSNVIKASARKFVEATGWERHFSIKETLGDILDYWRENAIKSRPLR